MRTPLEAVLLILSYEQLGLQVYRDAVGYLTAGWGHKLSPHDGPLGRGDTISREKANEWFLGDLLHAENGALIRLNGAEKLSPLQLGALVSLAFNVGAAGLGDGLLAAVRDDPAAVPGWIRKYNKAGGKVLAGLIERREAEARLWVKGSDV